MTALSWMFYNLLAWYDRATLNGLGKQGRYSDPYYTEIVMSELLNAAKAEEAKKRIDWLDIAALVGVIVVMTVLVEWAIRIALEA